jgi:parallel beta-helix repeat protein
VTDAFVLRVLSIINAEDYEGAAIRIAFSSGGRIEGCAVSASIHGVKIISSTGIAMSECALYVSGRGLRVDGESPEEFHHDIDATNTINDLQVFYAYGLDGETISGKTTSHLTVADSRNVTITDNDVSNGDGIQLAFVTDSVISGNTSYRTIPMLTEHGIHLYRSDRNTLSGNSLRNNRLAGIQLTLSSENEIRENEFLANDTGLRFLASDRNRAIQNVAFANVGGIVLTGGSSDNTVLGNVIYHENTARGILLETATGNVIDRNGLTGCEIGIMLTAGATENQITANTIVSGSYGFSIEGSNNDIERNLISQQSRGMLFTETLSKTTTQGNVIRGNVFADNANHLYVNLDSTGNTFTENVFLGDGVRLVADHGTGNLWSADGVGNYWDQTPVEDANGDGIGDSPITVYPAAVDDFAPLASIVPAEAGVGILGTLSSATVSIETEDGETAEVPVVRAIDGFERWAGFRGFPETLLQGFPGILFEFEEEAERRFTMETVLFDLDIAFFGADGSLVGRTKMEADSEELYSAVEPAQYALELPAGTLDALSIDAGCRLVLP